jgi:hypothetical protein
MKNDDDYKKNQGEAQTTWLKNNADYWQNYRKNHPGYVERNRKLQKKRNEKFRKRLKVHEKTTDMVAKMDALIKKNNLISGYYMLYPVALGKVAKMDEIIVRIDVITKT